MRNLLKDLKYSAEQIESQAVYVAHAVCRLLATVSCENENGLFFDLEREIFNLHAHLTNLKAFIKPVEEGMFLLQSYEKNKEKSKLDSLKKETE